MDFRAFDRARRQAGPLELDLVESYAKGSVSRREFVRRGAIDRPLAAVHERHHQRLRQRQRRAAAAPRACAAGTSGGTQPAGTGAGKAGGTIKVASQKPAGPLDPVAMQDLGRLRDRRPELRVPGHAGGQRHRARPGREVVAQRRRQRVDLPAPQGRQVAGRHGLHLCGCRRHHGPHGRGRQLGPQGRHREGRGGRLRPQRRRVHARRRRTATSRTSSRSTTPSRSSRPRTTRRGPRSTASPTAPDRSSWSSTTPRPARRSPATTTGGAARRRWTAPSSSSSTTSARRSRPPPAGEVDAIVQFQVIGGDALFSDPNFNVLRSRPPPTARSGCAATRASSPTSWCARRWRTRSTASR